MVARCLAAATLVLLAGGCDDGGPSDAERRAALTAACVRVAGVIDSLPAPTSVGALSAQLDDVQAAVASGRADLAELDAPADLQAALEAVATRIDGLATAAATFDLDALRAAATAAEPDLDGLDATAASTGAAGCTSESLGRVTFVYALELTDG
jgi:hypothetical protein